MQEDIIQNLEVRIQVMTEERENVGSFTNTVCADAFQLRMLFHLGMIDVYKYIAGKSAGKWPRLLGC